MDKEPLITLLHFMRMLGIKIGNQLELAYLTGISTAGAPAAVDINQLFDGWRYQVDSNGGHVVDGSTVNPAYTDRFLSSAKLSKAIKVIPTKYRTRNMDYRFLFSPNIYQDFIDILGNRATPLGDVAFRAGGFESNLPSMGGNSVLGYGAMPVFPVPLMPETDFVAKPAGVATTTNGALVAGATTATLTASTGIVVGDYVKIGTGGVAETVLVSANAANVITFATTPLVYGHNSGVAAVQGTADGAGILLTHFQNFIVGIQRDIRIELDRRPRERATYAVVTLRVDCNMENPDAASHLTNLAVRP